MILKKSLSVLLLSLSSFVASRPIESFRWGDIEYVYVFGDSYTFVPGTFGLESFSFIGDATKLAFTPEQLLTNEIIPNKTSSGGSNWIEYLTGCLEGLPSSCPRQLWDFAHGGADISGSMVPQHRITTVQVADQVQQWLDYASHILPRPDGKTLTVWWAGINDCTAISNNATITDVDAFIDADLEVYFNIIKTAARNKLHKHLILNVPPIDESPKALSIRTGPEGLKKTIDTFNEKLAARAKKYAKENPDQLIMVFDANSAFRKFLSHPQEFGFDNVQSACTTCEDQERIFWHNDEHPTEHVHRILAKAIEEYLKRPIL